MTKEYDLAIIGGGPGGYVAAIRAAQLGMQVAMIEKEFIGGTCLHNGCIPSKTLLQSAEVFRQAKEAELYGVELSPPKLNFFTIQQRKEKVINQLHQGVNTLMQKHQIDVFQGTGRLLGPSIFSPIAGTVSIEYEDERENTLISPKNVLIATGSIPKTIDGIPFDGEHILSSDDALHLEELPKSIIIVGGGVLGIEWASMLADFGSDVTIIEREERLLTTEDQDVSLEIEKQIKSKGVHVYTESEILPNTLKINNGIMIDAFVQNKQETFMAEKMLISIGREANVHNIGLENTEIDTDQHGINTNEFYQTKESHIYAIGDCIGGMQLAHVASREGIIAVEHMAGKNPLPLHYEHVPACVYSHPEVASVGLTEQQAKDKGFDIKVGKFPFQASAKALIQGEYTGFVKVIANKENEDLLGIHMVGPSVTELVAYASFTKVFDATPWEISQNLHPHPSLSEALMEAALSIDHLQIHL